MFEKIKASTKRGAEKIRAMNWKDLRTRRILIIGGVAVLVIIAAGVGYTIYHQKQTASAATSTNAVQTAVARMGSIVIDASGSGTLVGGNNTSLSFPIAGTVKDVLVRVGQEVKKGQALANLEDPRLLQAAVSEAEGNLAAAQKAKDDLLTSGPANLAAAQQALVTAQVDENTAENKVLTWVSHRGSDSMIDTADSNLAVAGVQLDNANAFFDKFKSRPLTDPDRIEAQSRLISAQTAYQQAKTNLDYLEAKPAPLEVQKNDYALAIVQAAVKKAESDLKFLQDNNGINPADSGVAESNLVTAQVALDKAKEDLSNATLKAPFDGTILTIAAKVGDDVTTDPFITMADLRHPDINFSYDETDMDKVAVGNKAQIVFDALPDSTFNATVSSVNPSLTAQGGVSVLTGVATLDDANNSNNADAISGSTNTPLQRFVEGMTASVDVINAQVQNVLLVPVEAVRDLGDGQYGVFVVGSDGKITLKIVTLGLKDITSAEIKSGLTAGETVTTGVVQTKSSSNGQ
jgi:multidrug efflux pump subunit AcrA (membrane-fusion protein)